jgi:hypothetical protein
LITSFIVPKSDLRDLISEAKSSSAMIPQF